MSRVAVLALVLAGCDPKVIATLDVAEGWEDTPPLFLLAPTDCVADGVMITATRSGSFLAAHVGTTTLHCKDGEIRTTVAPIATMSIRAQPTAASGIDVNVDLVAADASGGELRLDNNVVWDITGAVAPREPHNDMDFIGPAVDQFFKAPQHSHFKAGMPGTVKVHATWHGHTADAVVNIR